VNLRAEPTTLPPLLRRARPTLPPKAALAALRVSAAGEVVTGAYGYFWYGEAYALATDGPEGAQYLLGGASVPHAAVVALAAVREARQWQRERPGQTPEEEWLARAFWLADGEDALLQHAAGKLGARALVIYRAAWAAALARRR